MPESGTYIKTAYEPYDSKMYDMSRNEDKENRCYKIIKNKTIRSSDSDLNINRIFQSV